MSQAPLLTGSARRQERLDRRQRLERTSRLALGGLLVVTSLVLLGYLIAALQWSSQPFFGALLSPTLVVTNGQPVSDEAWTALEAGLQSRDRILALDGETLKTVRRSDRQAFDRFNEILRSKAPGDVLRVDVERPDGSVETVDVTLMRFPLGDLLVYFVISFIAAAFSVIAAGLVLLLRVRQSGSLLSVAVFLSTALVMAGMFDTTSSQAFMPIWFIAAALAGGTMMSLGLVFPSPLSVVYRMPVVRSLPLVGSAGAAAFALYNYNAALAPRSYWLSNQVVLLWMIGGLLVLGGTTLVQRRRATSQITRDQSSTLLLGLMLGSAPAGVWVFGQVVQTISPDFALNITLEASMPLLLVPIIAQTYALLQYQHFSAERVLSRSITYLILMFTLIIGYFLLVLGAGLALRDLQPDNPLLIALTLFLVSVALLPLRNWLESRINRVYYRQRREYQEYLERFSEKLNALNGYDEIITEFRSLLHDAINPSSVFIFLPRAVGEEFIAYGRPNPETNIRFAADSGLVDLLRGPDGPVLYLQPDKPYPLQLIADRARLHILKPLVLAGLSGSQQLNAILTIGPPRSGPALYGHEALRFINAMVGQLSVAIERTQVIDYLERRVNELNVLSQVGQAVNYTIEFDYLLELVYAQTGRLIDAPNFYIALYDQRNEQMYFAFFLENDERYRDRENLRWRTGRDAFSEVVRSGKPLMLADYEKAVKDGDYTPIFGHARIKAWMAVPLSAQFSTLGVLAVGQAAGDSGYTREQLKIFSDIGALAATSLEKASLFREVNVRAEQLAALNDISQKLVAAESEDVESLLELITASAVNILNVEAGSLLLNADEEGREMEFRVAVGGTGADLVGKRIPSDRGLVGEVVRSGQPQISNDTNSDQRWAGELTTSGSFSTASILAVPLIAKDTIIGVLEVLNKSDGTPFVNEEVELMTTFAGQAAIAIENARLFQMTGSALSERVKELQTLEQIDRELARELDIDRVAQITIKWAVANSGAVAAALGEVYAQENVLLMRSIYGYRDDEYPVEADGKRWPLDVGIVKRVLRTGLPDLADPSIDPDYVPTLTGATSQITVPMVSGEEIIAILILETNSAVPFNLLDLEFIKRLTERASIALSNAQLYSAVVGAADTKSEFVGFAAHELKNPLTSIKGYADGLLGPMGEQMNDDMRRQWLRVIRTNADRMQSIIDDMRDIARSDAGRLEIDLAEADIYQIVHDSILPFEQQIAEKEQTIHNTVAQDLPPVHGDHQKLVQVVVNLVSNAHKYTPEGGTITVGAEVLRNYRQGQRRYGAVMKVWVSDTGIGMSEEDLQRIFREDYFRSENRLAREQKGTGLGMIITERIIQAHEGRIWVESELNVGTTFSFVVPLFIAEAADTPDDSHEADTDTRIASSRADLLHADTGAFRTATRPSQATLDALSQSNNDASAGGHANGTTRTPDSAAPDDASESADTETTRTEPASD